MIKLAAFDVDCTLRERDTMPDSVRPAIRRLQEQGVVTVLCTGRSEYEMAPLREELGIEWAITCNGSHIGHRGKTVFGNAFPQEKVREWLARAERERHAMLLYGSKEMFANVGGHPLFHQARREIGFVEPVLLGSGGAGEATGAGLAVPDIFQCIVFCDEEAEAGYIGGPGSSTRGDYYINRWRPWAVDFNPRKMNKAMGLRKLLDHLAIAPEEAAAFGDGFNDLEMIESVGLGIAMGNAIEELKRKAKYVTRRWDEDGIAYAIERWLLPVDGR
jgi:Cof subfamily protein (haloacid dehalogenase superfamily)